MDGYLRVKEMEEVKYIEQNFLSLARNLKQIEVYVIIKLILLIRR